MTPVSPSVPRDIQVPGISAAKVDLAATFDPITPWLTVFRDAVSNAVGIGEAVAADPAPALRQVIANQLGYAETVVNGLTGLGENAFRYVTEIAPLLLGQAFDDLAQGDIVGAAEQVNNLVGQILLVALPLFDVTAIPGQIANNFARVVNTVTGFGVLLPLVAGVLGPIQGVVTAAGEQGQAFVDAVGAGDPVSAFNALINLPAVVTGALINGYESSTGNSTPGLLTPGLDGFGGLVYSLFVAIPKAIANALKPTPVLLAAQSDEQSIADPGAVPQLDTAAFDLQASVEQPDAAPTPDSDPAAEAAREEVPAVENDDAEPLVEAVDESVLEVEAEDEAETLSDAVAAVEAEAEGQAEPEAEAEASGTTNGSTDTPAAEESETQPPASESDPNDTQDGGGGAGDGGTGDGGAE